MAVGIIKGTRLARARRDSEPLSIRVRLLVRSAVSIMQTQDFLISLAIPFVKV